MNYIDSSSFVEVMSGAFRSSAPVSPKRSPAAEGRSKGKSSHCSSAVELSAKGGAPPAKEVATFSRTQTIQQKRKNMAFLKLLKETGQNVIIDAKDWETMLTEEEKKAADEEKAKEQPPLSRCRLSSFSSAKAAGRLAKAQSKARVSNLTLVGTLGKTEERFGSTQQPFSGRSGVMDDDASFFAAVDMKTSELFRPQNITFEALMKDEETTQVPSLNKIGSPGKLASTNTSVLEGTAGSSKLREQPTALYSTTRP